VLLINGFTVQLAGIFKYRYFSGDFAV